MFAAAILPVPAIKVIILHKHLLIAMHKIDLTDSLEKIPVKIFPTSAEGSFFIAQQIASLIRSKEKEGKKCG